MKDSILKSLVLAAVTALFSIATLHAQTKTWVGGTSTDWNIANNWSASGVPGSGNSVIINTNSGNQPVLSSGANASLGSGTVTVGNSSGNSGNNTALTIQNSKTLSDTSGIVGNAQGAVGHVYVTTSAGWTNSGSLTLGSSGTGFLNVQTGGTVSSASASLGASSTGVGTAIVDGTASHWTTGNINVGNQGVGALEVSYGGSVSSTQAILGNLASGNGVVSVHGTNATWAVSGGLTIGASGFGNVNIFSAGLVTAAGLSMGAFNGSSGTLTVSGGTFTTGGAAVVGANIDTGTTTATLTISDGGLVNATNASGLNVARDSGTTGTLNIGDYAGGSTAGSLNSSAVAFGSGTGTINFNQTDSTTFSANISGNGAVNQRGTGTTAETGTNTYTGTTTVSDGSLLVNGSHTVGSGASGAYLVNGTGTLGGNGTINLSAVNLGVTVASGGHLSPGNADAGNLTLTLGTGVLDISAAVGGSNTGALLFDLAGVSASDKITLTLGTLNIGTGVLNFNDFSFSALSGFTEGSYTLIDTNSLITGTLGSSLTGTVSGRSVTITVSGDGKDLVANVGAVPEPSTYALFALGGATLFLISRKRKQTA